jgi:hypothetical protein
MLETAISFVSGVIVPIAIHYLQQSRKKKREKAKDVVLSHLEIQKINQEITDSVREELDADRVSIVKFSNGTDFLDNTHILNVTIVNESNANGFENIKQDFQRLPAYMFDRVLNLLKINDFYVEKNSEINTPYDTVKAIRQSWGLETVLGVKLIDKKGKWKGILLVGWEVDKSIGQEEIGYSLVKSKQIQ